LLQHAIFCQKTKIDGPVCRDKRCFRPGITFGRTATIAIMFWLWR
jgi:hypothetical protein